MFYIRVLWLPVRWRHLRNHSYYCALMLCHFGKLRNSSMFIQFTHSAALLQSTLQATKELFRNGSVETRNRLVEMKNELRKLLVPFRFSSQMKLEYVFRHLNVKSWNLNIPSLPCPMKYLNFLHLWVIPLICSLWLSSFCRHENEDFDAFFGQIRPVCFLSKFGKYAIYEPRNG